MIIMDHNNERKSRKKSLQEDNFSITWSFLVDFSELREAEVKI